jgi:hypothetical protein
VIGDFYEQDFEESKSEKPFIHTLKENNYSTKGIKHRCSLVILVKKYTNNTQRIGREIAGEYAKMRPQ